MGVNCTIYTRFDRTLNDIYYKTLHRFNFYPIYHQNNSDLSQICSEYENKMKMIQNNSFLKVEAYMSTVLTGQQGLYSRGFSCITVTAIRIILRKIKLFIAPEDMTGFTATTDVRCLLKICFFFLFKQNIWIYRFKENTKRVFMM